MKRNILCKLGFHDWEYFYEPYQKTFLGDKYTAYLRKFRICRRCGKAQATRIEDININNREKEILLKKIKEGALISEMKIKNEPKREY